MGVSRLVVKTAVTSPNRLK